jgi:hypothetical protein
MAKKFFWDSERWQERAEDARKLATEILAPVSRRKMLEIAESYEAIARRGEAGREQQRDAVRQRLEIAERHVALGEKTIGRQREAIADLERGGHDAAFGKSLLKKFEELQALHVSDRDRHRKMLSGSAVF